jgi:hypothetical protein
MRNLIILLLVCSFIHAQANDSIPNPITPYYFQNGWLRNTQQVMAEKGILTLAQDTSNAPIYPYSGLIYTNYYGGSYWYWNGSSWQGISSGSVTTDTLGGKITTNKLAIGNVAPNGLSATGFLKWALYGNQPPTSGLTGGTTLELTSSSTVSETLNWTAGRGSNTPILTSVVVAGISESFSQPPQNGSTSGNQTVSVLANTTTTYSNVVTAQDGQTATATTQFNFLGKNYYGLLNDTTGIGTGGQDANILALVKNFASTRALTTTTGTVTGTKFWVYVYPASLGTLTSLTFNGFPSLASMNLVTRNFTNSQGYTQSYLFYYNKNGQTTASSIVAQ